MVATLTAATDRTRSATVAVAGLFFAVCTWGSYARWANFEYRTFDLAFYVQATWQLLHGRFSGSLLGVPLLGNHVEPIVFLIAPLFALFRHPLTFVVVQNAALATMAPVGARIATRLGFAPTPAAFLGSALLVAPAAGYVALHEFHPEALAAPLLLLMFHARLCGSLARHWLWFVGALACKENIALLLMVYCAVQLVIERKRGPAELRGWYGWPLALSFVWFLACTKLITPTLNASAIDYAALYDRLGASAPDILRNAFTDPRRITHALTQSITHGNLVTGLLLPFLALPLFRPRWLLIAAPVLLQHLLSWRSSEWTIYFHYAAPLLPIFWMGAVESAAALSNWKRGRRIQGAIPVAMVGACIVAQLALGPAAAMVRTTADWLGGRSHRHSRQAMIANIPPNASVVAPLGYVSHLAMREQLYSLHHILKGLKTLSRSAYEPPPPTDYVLLDYEDSATFDASSGYFHPVMRTVDGRIIPSSEQLLHDFLKQAQWLATSKNEVTLLRRSTPRPPPAAPNTPAIFSIATHTQLLSISKSADVLRPGEPIDIRLIWNFAANHDAFPWMLLALTKNPTGERILITKGLCAPECDAGIYAETWRITSHDQLTAGEYSAEALFVDNSNKAWAEATDQRRSDLPLLAPPVPLGTIRISDGSGLTAP